MKVLNRQQVYNEERRIQNEWAKRDFEREKMLEGVYRESIDHIQNKLTIIIYRMQVVTV